MADNLSPSAQRVQDALRAFGMTCQVVELPASTRTAAEAATAIGCRVEQIAKSLLFKGQTSGKPVLAIVSGNNRVSEQALSTAAGEPVAKADADFAKQQTGYVIGGVPPVGHVEKLESFIDEDLLQHNEIWAAAGTPHAVFRLTPGELQEITGGHVIRIK
jgi:prolyl-tRNA editing enzyme YbaK/EbsC (Cys-tRNA(Pro) deacylase)